MRFFPVLCVFLLASVRSFCQSVPITPTTSAAPSKEAGTISGTVFRADTGEPLKKARVTLDDRGAETVYVVYVTDEQGHFAFENVPPGSYRLNVSRNGFVDAEYGQTRPGAAGAVLTLAAGQSMTDLVFKLARAGAISGHVFDEDGEPVAKASIIFYRASKRSGKEQRNDDQPVLTNDLGAYRIFDLAPGRYYVAVNYRSEDWLPHPSPAANQKIDTGYLPSYYPNTTDSARAQAISVGPGDEIGSVDFFLRPSLVVTVSGKVINATAMPPNSSGRVRLEPRGSGLVDAVQNLSDDFRGKDGSFTIRNVPPRSYNLVASWTEPETREWHIARRPLDVGDSDVNGVTITISPGVDIIGHVTWEGSSPKDLERVVVQFEPLGEEPFMLPGQGVKANGTFRFKNVPEGSYRAIVVPRGANFFLKSVRCGTLTVTDNGFTVQAGSEATLELTVSNRAAKLDGVVLNANSLPAVGAAVVLIPGPPHRDIKYRYMAATTDQNGVFSITGITPGDHKILSWDSIDEADEEYGEDWYDAEWLKPYEGKGESVHLEEADRKSLNLKVIPSGGESSAAN